jgi:DNA helicase-2/ATP-dependent DNA helicase PcrA
MELNERFIKIKRKLFSAYYDKLNKMQREAVFTVNGPLLVLAGAGSGKTTVLVNRIAHMLNFGDAYYTDNIPSGIDENTVAVFEQIYENINNIPKEDLKNLLLNFSYDAPKPWEILSITFTNKAAGEMKERLLSILGESALDIWAGTFHSVCVKMLRINIDRIGYEKTFSIYDTDDSKKIISNIIKELNLDDEMFVPKTVLSIISRYKNKLIFPDSENLVESNDFKEKTIAEIYKRYQNSLKSANAVDFDDIICLTIKLLKECPDILEKYRSRFRYILVDEYQDTNGAQLELMRLLCGKYKNIMVVGDDDQSIYKFRGAVIQNILSFDSHFKNAKVVYLEQNYRSTKTILNAANAVISHNEGRKGKVLWTEVDDGEKIDYIKLDNQDMEARYIVDRINDYVKKGSYKYGDFAVLYRINAQSNNLETAFAKAGIPHRLLGGTRFYDRKEIKDIVAYLAVVSNPNDTVKLERIVNVPKRGIGDGTLSAVKLLAHAEGKSVFEIMETADNYTALKKSSSKLIKFAELIASLRKIAESDLLPELIKHTVYDSGYYEMLSNSVENERDRIDNINELISNAMKFIEDNPEGTLEQFLEDVALVADVDSYEENADAVVLMTIHSAKGLEFPVVFLPGMEEFIIPSAQSSNSQEDLEEERRLAYVAITRAKKKLIVTNAASRLMFGRTSMNQTSRFVREIPPLLINDINSQIANMNKVAELQYNNNTGNISTSNFKKTENVNHAEFKVGESVIHPTFGQGVIIQKKEMSSDTLYEIAFDSVGTKKIMGTYARLKKA